MQGPEACSGWKGKMTICQHQGAVGSQDATPLPSFYSTIPKIKEESNPQQRKQKWEILMFG